MDRIKAVLDFIADNWQPLIAVFLLGVLTTAGVNFAAHIDWQLVANGAGVAFALKVLVAFAAPWFIAWQLRHMDRRLGWKFREWFSGLPAEEKVPYASTRILAYCIFYGLLFGL